MDKYVVLVKCRLISVNGGKRGVAYASMRGVRYHTKYYAHARQIREILLCFFVNECINLKIKTGQIMLSSIR